MSVTRQELDRFHRFVARRLQNGTASLTLEETLAQFRAHQPTLSGCIANCKDPSRKATGAKALRSMWIN